LSRYHWSSRLPSPPPTSPPPRRPSAPPPCSCLPVWVVRGPPTARGLQSQRRTRPVGRT
jgi:hypothetical protein